MTKHQPIFQKIIIRRENYFCTIFLAAVIRVHITKVLFQNLQNRAKMCTQHFFRIRIQY